MLRPLIMFCNAAPYLEQCIKSLLKQKHRDWHCHVYDDCSTDGGLEIARAAAGGDPRFTFVSNKEKMWQLGNMWQFSELPEVNDHDIVFCLDGDDWLPDDECVFDRVMAAYADGRIWVTYGNFHWLQPDGASCTGFCETVREAARIRQLPWTASLPRTFKMFLLRKISKSDLEDPAGGFLHCTGDMATMFPMIEMAGDRRSLCLSDINYIYNGRNPNSDSEIRRARQLEVELFLRALTPYPLLDEADVPAKKG